MAIEADSKESVKWIMRMMQANWVLPTIDYDTLEEIDDIIWNLYDASRAIQDCICSCNLGCHGYNNLWVCIQMAWCKLSNWKDEEMAEALGFLFFFAVGLCGCVYALIKDNEDDN